MGAFQSSFRRGGNETKFDWVIEKTPHTKEGLYMSPVFIQDKEAFVCLLYPPTETLIIYCCSALQWSFDEFFDIKIKIHLDKKKINTRSTFTKRNPFCLIKYDASPSKISIKIQMPPFYPYTREERFVGIRNSGATCYMAAVLQILYNLGAFRQLIYSFNQPPKLTSAIQQLFVELQLSSKPPTVDKLLRALGNAAEIARIQQDTHEFLLALLDNLEHELGIVFGNNIKVMMSVNINVSTTDKDKNTKITEESVLTLPLVVDSLHSVIESISLMTAPETISSDEGDIIQKRSFTKLPPVLALHLCRFKFSRTEGKVIEVKTRFDCPNTINLKEFVDDFYNDETEYNLFAVVAHCGNPESGHYISYIKLCGKWMKFDDITVTQVDFAEVQQTFGNRDDQNSSFTFLFNYGAPVAYLVFYVRNDCDQFIDAGDDVPVFLAPYRSNCLFSRFIFSDNIKGSEILSNTPFFEWSTKSDSISEVIKRIRPDFNQANHCAWTRFPGNALFLGPIDLNEKAENYIVKGHSNIFFILPKSLNPGPVFLLTESLPRKVVGCDIAENIHKSLPENAMIMLHGHTMKTCVGMRPGTNALEHLIVPIKIIVNNTVYQMPQNSTYSDLQQRVALTMNASPSKILFYTQEDIIYPGSYPYATMFPSKVSALILDNDITAKSISLYTPIRLILVYPSHVKKIEWPLWMKIGSSVSDIETEVHRRYPDFRVNEHMKLQFSRGTETCIEKIYQNTDIPTKGITRIDTVRDVVPSKRNEFKEILGKGNSFSIEVRLMKKNIFYGVSRLLSINSQTTLRDIFQKMLRMSKISDEFSRGKLFITEKQKIEEEIEPDDIIFKRLQNFISKMTAPKQRICLSIETQDPLQAGMFIIRSYSGYFRPE